MSLFDFFRPYAKCAICGEEVGLNRYKIGTTLEGEAIWKCPECARKGGLIYIDRVTGQATIGNPEYRKKCNVCGHIYCYTFQDLANNRQKAKSAMLSSVAGISTTLGGAYAAGAMNEANAQHALDQIVDYNRCPRCGSTDICDLNDEEWAAAQIGKESERSSNTLTSVADELKKFKDLLDSGVITEEEFEAKKKQLLGL